MHRRGFLIGIGALLTAPYVAKVQTALAQKAMPVPLITEAEADEIVAILVPIIKTFLAEKV